MSDPAGKPAADTPELDPPANAHAAVAATNTSVTPAHTPPAATDPHPPQPAAAPDAEADDERAPRRLHLHTLLNIVVVLAVLYTCYFASGLIVPVLLAVFIALCGNPVVSALHRLRLPRWLGALTLISGGLAAAVFGAMLLITPAAEWLRHAPTDLRPHLPTLREWAKPLQEASKASESLQRMTEVGPPAPPPLQVVEQPRGEIWSMLSSTPRTLATVLAVVMLSFFFMVYGENLLRRVVTAVPGWRRKRITVDILRTVQADLSRYVLTVSAINLGLGTLTALALWGIGLSPYDALLWGVVAGMLNFAPYVGPLFTAIALLLVGLSEFPTLGQAAMPPVAFLALHLLEGQLVTPLILGQRMAISPVILLLWLFLWGWMWGVPGLLLAVPLLVCFKIWCTRIESMRRWATLMEP